MQHRQGHWAVHYLVVVLTILLRRVLDPILHERLPLIAQFAAVTFTAWYAGRGPAIAALLLGTFAAVYFLLEPRGSFVVSHPEDIFGLVVFSILQVGSIALFEQLRRARDRAELQAQEIQQQYKELQDATRRRRDAEAVALSEGERLKVTLASIGDAVITTDRAGLVTFLNEIAIRLTGWSLEEARGVPLETVFQIVSEITREPVDNPALRSLREGSIVGLANHTVLIAKDGSECPIDDSAAPIRDQDGNIFGSVLVFRDISDRKQVERHRNARLAVTSALNQSREPQSGVAGVLAAVCENLAWEVGFFWKVGTGPDELSCDTTWTRPDVPLEDFVKATCSRSFRRGEGLPGRVWEQGEPAWILDIAEDPNFPRLNAARSYGLRSALACSVREGEETLGVIEFFTRRIREADPDLLELMGTVAGHLGQFLERKQAEAELRDADRRKDEFLAMLAHELRNPLAPISNGLQVLRLAGTHSAAVTDALSMMERQLGQMVRLVDDLLDVSRITRNKLDLRKQRVELAAIVNSAVETSRPLIEHAGHGFTVSIPEQPVFLEADLTRVAQVLSNLLNNSAKYTEPGGRIELRAAIEGNEVAIAVRDNGVGIPAEALSRIFEMFSQVDLNLDRAQGGLGIGLTLVRRLVEMHGGTVEARSDGPGKGSEFVVRLPILVAGGNGQADTAAATREATAIHKQRILIIDDNHDAATSLGMMLKLMGNETYTAHDGLAGVEAAASYRPHIILLDIGLPKLNGYDACRQIRAQPWSKGMVIVALTGWGQDEDRRRSAEAGFDHHLVKPVEVDALARLLGG